MPYLANKFNKAFAKFHLRAKNYGLKKKFYHFWVKIDLKAIVLY